MSYLYFKFLKKEIWSNILEPTNITLTPDETQKNQTIIGFGGAFTDAAGINIAKLSSGAQQNLISSYFGPEGELHL